MKQSTSIINLIKIKTYSQAINAFCFEYSYDHNHLATAINLHPKTFSNKLKLNNFTANERISISEFIRSKV